MTIQECQEQHKKLWNWIADETERTGRLVYKYEYFRAMHLEEIYNNCYACEYDKGDCKKCPIDWEKVGVTFKDTSCEAYPSPYQKWNLQRIRCSAIYFDGGMETYPGVDDIKISAALAREIANLPFKRDCILKDKK